MKSIRFIALVTSFSLMLPFQLSAEEAAKQASTANSSTPVTRGEIHEMVKEAIMKEPEMVMLAIRKLREKQEEESKKASAEAFKRHKADLMSDKLSPSAGNPNANVTVIEFFDYHCGYCKHLVPTITKLLEEDKNVRVVFREYPILSEDSVAASRAALAVHRLAPDKYFQYHTALMKSQGKYDEATLLNIGKDIGISPEKLKQEMDKPEVTDMLEKNRAIGEDLGVRGTPAIFVGDKMLPGAIPYATLKRLVAEARGEKPATQADNAE